jgi:hypothetical protein
MLLVLSELKVQGSKFEVGKGWNFELDERRVRASLDVGGRASMKVGEPGLLMGV